ncbi:MAG: Phage portal protein lambda family [Phycisphaerales bacterium]|nr:Phage portal protein lambda family [Phycisphaerales bacterium]
MLYEQYIPGLPATATPPVGAVTRFGYDAVEHRGRRQPPMARTLSEDDELRSMQRRMLGTAAADLQRNFALAAWAIRKHLDYVSTFRFQARTGNPGFDDAVETLVRERSRPAQCDASRRFSLQGLVRLAECLRTVGGDCGWLRREDGRVQLIEHDRIATPYDMAVGTLPPGRTANDLVNGVLIGPSGEPLAYAVNKRLRVTGGMTFERMVPAEFLHLHGYFTRYDQVRGISPLAAAVNTFRDVYENFDYALARSKIEQLFAFIITRKSAEEFGNVEATVTGGTDGQPERTKYDLKPPKGPIAMDLDPGDDAKFLSSANPSDQFQSFTAAMIQVGLKALDLPLSFYDESHTNWVGTRQALMQYEMGAESKREGNRQLCDGWTAWQIALALRDGRLALPRGIAFNDIRWQWIPRNIRWTDPLKEVTANIAAVNAGLKSPQLIIQDEGNDAFEMIDQIAEWQKYVRDAGVTLTSTLPIVPPDAPEDPTNGRRK